MLSSLYAENAMPKIRKHGGGGGGKSQIKANTELTVNQPLKNLV